MDELIERQVAEMVTPYVEAERKAIAKYIQIVLRRYGEMVRVPSMSDVKVLHPLDLKKIINELKAGQALKYEEEK